LLTINTTRGRAPEGRTDHSAPNSAPSSAKAALESVRLNLQSREKPRGMSVGKLVYLREVASLTGHEIRNLREQPDAVGTGNLQKGGLHPLIPAMICPRLAQVFSFKGTAAGGGILQRKRCFGPFRAGRIAMRFIHRSLD
jgi:hypothetical protein